MALDPMHHLAFLPDELELSAEDVATLTRDDYQRLREIGATQQMIKTNALARAPATDARTAFAFPEAARLASLKDSGGAVTVAEVPVPPAGATEAPPPWNVFALCF